MHRPSHCEQSEANQENVGRPAAPGLPRANGRLTMRKYALVAFTAIFGSAQAAETDFLFDVLHGRTAYHASWDKLMKLVQPTPDWLAQFNRDLHGVAGPPRARAIAGHPHSMS